VRPSEVLDVPEVSGPHLAFETEAPVASGAFEASGASEPEASEAAGASELEAGSY
jgi:hypothetical protein